MTVEPEKDGPMSKPWEQRTCRCGLVISNDARRLIEHIGTQEHADRLKALGVFTHSHSYLWVNDADVPVERDAPGAHRYFKAGCDACENEVEPEW